MAVGGRNRTTFIEYGSVGKWLSGSGDSLERNKLVSKVLSMGERIQGQLHLSRNPISYHSGGFKITDIAGLIQIDPKNEIEVAPKFLGTTWTSWREDFFYILMLSRNGRLLPRHRVSSGTETKNELVTLVAQSVIMMYWDCYRRPLKTYRLFNATDFMLEGDFEAEDLLLPSDDGFQQKILSYDRLNIFNATILGAVRTLLPAVREPQTRRQLARVEQALAPQVEIRKVRRQALPSRSRKWSNIYELAVDVLDGFGMSYSPKKLQAPGFVVDTWKIWEDLVTLALRAEIGSSLVFSQKSERLGTRKSNRNGIGNVGSVWVVPDMKIGGALGQVVDAKYKGRAGEQRIRIAESDLYESLAFATATKQNLVVLLYPAVPADSVAPVVGQTKEFERISVGEVQVIGLEIEVRGISASGAFGQFKKRLADAVRAVKLNL